MFEIKTGKKETPEKYTLADPTSILIPPPKMAKKPRVLLDKNSDPYIRFVAHIHPRPGLNHVEEAKLAGAHRSISLSFERTDDCPQKYATLRRDTNELLCKNAATALDADGIVRHVWTNDTRLKTFAGFCDQNLHPDKVLLLSAGAVFLKIEGLQFESKDKKVFAVSPDRFTLENEAGSVFIGHVRFLQPDWPSIASVQFDSGLGK